MLGESYNSMALFTGLCGMLCPTVFVWKKTKCIGTTHRTAHITKSSSTKAVRGSIAISSRYRPYEDIRESVFNCVLQELVGSWQPGLTSQTTQHTYYNICIGYDSTHTYDWYGCQPPFSISSWHVSVVCVSTIASCYSKCIGYVCSMDGYGWLPCSWVPHQVCLNTLCVTSA